MQDQKKRRLFIIVQVEMILHIYMRCQSRGAGELSQGDGIAPARIMRQWLFIIIHPSTLLNRLFVSLLKQISCRCSRTQASLQSARWWGVRVHGMETPHWLITLHNHSTQFPQPLSHFINIVRQKGCYFSSWQTDVASVSTSSWDLTRFCIFSDGYTHTESDDCLHNFT